MKHPLFRITFLKQVGTYTLLLRFDDGAERSVNLEPILEGELYGALRDPATFAQVKLDPEAHTAVWPCGADFDPAVLHDWPEHKAAFCEAASQWRQASVSGC